MGTVNIPYAITSKVDNLPALSTVALRIIEIVGDETHSMNDLVKVISSDAALTSRVLRIANSAAFSRGTPITSLPRAIVRMGEKMVVGVAVSVCAPEVFERELEGYAAKEGELWEHSLRTAIASREIAAFSRGGLSGDEAFTGGLLHDIGKAVISEFFTGKTYKMLSLFDEGKVESFYAAEEEIIGTDHAQVGYAVARRWNLPEKLCETILNHHHPADSSPDARELVYAVHIGDVLSMMGGNGTGADTFAYTIDEGFSEYFSFDEEDIYRVLLTVEEEFSSVKNFVSPKS